MSETILSLQNIHKTFGTAEALSGVSLEVERGEFLTLLGPSGCGKTTTLRMIGGFTTPTSGDVLFDGVRINDVPPNQRQINTVFQKYALFPHLNVFENIAFGLRMQRRPDPADPRKKTKIPEEEIRERVMEMLEIISLKGFENRRPDALSGGQQQRVAIARAIATRPPIILADEPTGALDSKTGIHVLQILQRLYKEGTTVILITHDNGIAATAPRVVRLSDGRVISDNTQEVDWL